MRSDNTYQGATLYFHSPCFDGIVSCLLAWEFLEQNGWTFRQLLPVNYDRKGEWLGELDKPMAVVDYPFHPNAAFWADHHQSAFLTPHAEDLFRARNNEFPLCDTRAENYPILLYDSHADSCSTLLWRRLARFFVQKPHYAELVEWAARIDSARYVSVDEAIFGNHPALQISTSLAVSETDYPEKLVRWLREHGVGEVAALPDVQSNFSKTHALTKAGLERFSQSARITNDQIVLFDVDCKGVLVNRYAPFYETSFRDARYSVGITRGTELVIRAMRNPWREFQSVPLGRIFATIGGGGHERVGSYIVPARRTGEAKQIVEQIVHAIRSYEHVGEIDIPPVEVPNRV